MYIRGLIPRNWPRQLRLCITGDVSMFLYSRHQDTFVYITVMNTETFTAFMCIHPFLLYHFNALGAIAHSTVPFKCIVMLLAV